MMMTKLYGRSVMEVRQPQHVITLQIDPSIMHLDGTAPRKHPKLRDQPPLTLRFATTPRT
jgi:hypothetical protein